MTKEQLYVIWALLPELKADLDSVIAYEIEKAKGQHEKVIKDRADYFRKIMHKYEAQRLEDCLRTIKELIPPENWELYTEAATEKVTEPTEQVTAPAKPKFDQDRFERVFCAIVASGKTETWEQDFKGTIKTIEKLDAYYASKEGGENG